MLKASALYIVIIISVIIALFSASLISIGYFYRLEHQKALRFSKLSANLASGIAIALSDDFKSHSNLDLYGEGKDSLDIQGEPWGLFQVFTVRAFHRTDTLQKAFFAGWSTADKTALYLSDEDRPLSISGSTEIVGEALLPKAGIKQAYVEGRPYSGARLVYGTIKNSGRNLPEPEAEVVNKIRNYLSDTVGLPGTALTGGSFFKPEKRVRFKQAHTLAGSYNGKVVIISDTIIKITKDARMENVIVAARVIVVEDGFKGTCQLYATDSVIVGRNAVLSYPSAVGVIKPASGKMQSKVQLGAGSLLEGFAFSYETSRSDLQTMVSLGKGAVVKGEVYAKGYIKMEKPVTVVGRASCNRFIIQTPTTLYENYLLDISINRNKRSKYYLTSALFKDDKGYKRVMKWLN